MKTYAPQIFRVILGYAGRGLLLAAIATTLTVTACGDEDEVSDSKDGAADTLGTDTAIRDALKPNDGGPDAKADASDAKPADAGGDAGGDAAVDVLPL